MGDLVFRWQLLGPHSRPPLIYRLLVILGLILVLGFFWELGCRAGAPVGRSAFLDHLAAS